MTKMCVLLTNMCLKNTACTVFYNSNPYIYVGVGIYVCVHRDKTRVRQERGKRSVWMGVMKVIRFICFILNKTSTIVRRVWMSKVIRIYCLIYFQNFWVGGQSRKKCSMLSTTSLQYERIWSSLTFILKSNCLSDIYHAKVSIVKPLALFFFCY